MKYLKRFLPHLGIAMSLAVLVLVYVNDRNPMMGFFSATVSSIYLVVHCLICIVLAFMVWRPKLRAGRHEEDADRH